MMNWSGASHDILHVSNLNVTIINIINVVIDFTN